MVSLIHVRTGVMFPNFEIRPSWLDSIPLRCRAISKTSAITLRLRMFRRRIRSEENAEQAMNYIIIVYLE